MVHIVDMRRWLCPLLEPRRETVTADVVSGDEKKMAWRGENKNQARSCRAGLFRQQGRKREDK